MRHIEKVGTLTIPSGQIRSAIMEERMGFGAATDLIIYCPAVMPETVSVKVGALNTAADGDMRVLQVNNLDVVLAAGRAVVVPTSTFSALQLEAGGAAAADRVFDIVMQVDL